MVRNRLVTVAAALLVGMGTFVCGLVAGGGPGAHYARAALARIAAAAGVGAVAGSTPARARYAGERELLRVAFVDKKIDKQLYPPSTGVAQVEARIDDMFVPAEAFPGAYERLAVRGFERLGPDVVRLDYELDGRAYRAFAYSRERAPGAAPPRVASLVIPGTGLNQSSEVYARAAANRYADVMPLVESRGDVFVLVKPNEDFLAIHDGERKLGYTFITAALINRGGSYSAHYMINGLALLKWMKSRYEATAAVGLSQGGTAAFYCALQAEPTAAVVASGWSIINDSLLWATMNQIVIPKLHETYAPDAIRRIVAASRTRYLFTYGLQEEATYRVDAQEGRTRAFFEGLANVTCLSHPGGHEYPVGAVDGFLAASLGDVDAARPDPAAVGLLAGDRAP